MTGDSKLRLDDKEVSYFLMPGKPLLKWAGGKTQLLPQLLEKIPAKYDRYIEPFIGGGALFFSLKPNNALIADSNPELINLYRTVKKFPNELISSLHQMKNDEAFFYHVRSLDFAGLSCVDAAARTIYLNRTCFNGLYRVNKSGKFNVPYGRYKNPTICDEKLILSCSRTLANTLVIEGDYKETLLKYAKEGDLIYLDPPYLPISKYSDFKRYTKEQFYEEDHHELAAEVQRLRNIGCHVILTNSNHPLVHELYRDFRIEIHKTKRHINAVSSGRTGEDVIVTAPKKKQANLSLVPKPINEQTLLYPKTRFMGSKEKLLNVILGVASQFKYESVLDLFSGSGVVSYMFKSEGKKVIANDYMAMCSTTARALIENNSNRLNEDDIDKLLNTKTGIDLFVSKTFSGLYYTDEENLLIDTIRSNIPLLKNQYKRAIATTSLVRACIKKRPRGIFTYTGYRYDDGRKDLQTSLLNQFMNAVGAINMAVFDNQTHNRARHGDAMSCRLESDLVYIDPPYFSPFSDNEYVRRYHFVEGLARDWVGVEMQPHTLTKKFKSYPTPFSSQKGAEDAFERLFSIHRNKIILVSYSSNSLPSLDRMVAILSNFKSVEVVRSSYRYSFGNQLDNVGDNNNSVEEYLFVGY